LAVLKRHGGIDYELGQDERNADSVAGATLVMPVTRARSNVTTHEKISTAR
jgi:hypothetical protein